MATDHIKDSIESAWENGELGMSAEHAVVAPSEVEAEVDAALCLQMISIRLPKKLIDDLKFIANKEGLGYQPLMRRVLIRFVASEFRSMAMDEAALGDDAYGGEKIAASC